MRTSAHSIKLNKSLSSEPKEGTKIRKMYDQFMDGSPVVVPYRRADGTATEEIRRMRTLREEYQMNIVSIGNSTYMLR